MTGAAPAWFADNLTPIALVTLLVLGVVLIKLVTTFMVRLAIGAVVLALGVFVYANRTQLEQCAHTCSCEVAGFEVDVPGCDDGLP